VKSILAAEDERAVRDATSTADTTKEDVLVLPSLDYSEKGKALRGCSGCPSLQPRDLGQD